MKQANGARRAALFDMDRTLVSVNSGRLYVAWRMRRGEYGLRDGLLAGRYLLQYSLGMIDAYAVAERTVRDLAGYAEARMREECQQWYGEVVRPYVTETARAEVQRCRDEGYEPAILSAQTNYAAQPLADDLGIEHVLCSRLEVEDGCFTGGFQRPLCYGDGKVALAARWAEQHGMDFRQSRFYSDSISDLPMLNAVAEPRVINPDPRLRLHARRRRWPIEVWK